MANSVSTSRRPSPSPPAEAAPAAQGKRKDIDNLFAALAHHNAAPGAVRSLIELSRNPATSREDRQAVMRCAVKYCAGESDQGRLQDVPRFLRCLAAECLSAPSSGYPANLRAALEASLGQTPPEPSLPAVLSADGLLTSGPKLQLSSNGDKTKWVGGKPSELLKGGPVAAPVTASSPGQAQSVKVLLLLQRNPVTGKTHCVVINGSGTPLTKDMQDRLTKGLKEADKNLKADTIEFFQPSHSVVAAASHPTTLFSVYLRALGEASPPLELRGALDLLRNIDVSLHNLHCDGEQRLRDLMRCETAWLHAASAPGSAGAAAEEAAEGAAASIGALDADHLYV